MMEHPNKSIGDLLRDIRLVETKHNELVDEYFQIKEQVKEALKNLNEDPTALHLSVYHQYLTQSESVMKSIRVERLKLTNLICLLEEHGVRLNEDEEDEEENENEISSCDEGIGDQSISVHDLSSKISSHDNSTIDYVF